MNIYDISEKAGVSIATVSRVINGSSNVSQKTRNKVLQVMKDTSYTPNVFARGLMLQSTKIIGVLCADASDAYLAKAVNCLERELRGFGYDCILCCTGHEQKEKEKAMQLLISKKVDAIILVGSNYVSIKKQENQFIYKAAKDLPVIIVNAFLEGDNIYCAYCDDKEAVRSATAQLLGQKKEVLFLYNSLSYSGRKKLEGYKKAHEDMRITIADTRIVCGAKTLEGTVECLELLEQKGVTFQSVIATEDYLAIAVLKHAKKRGITIPGQLQVIGYNDSVLAKCCEPELTSIDNKVEELCRYAVSDLLQILGGKETLKSQKIPCRLVCRETTF